MKEIKFISLELIQNMSQDFVESHIDEDKLREIKEKDKSPTFNVFRIAHTGKTRSTIIGWGTRVLRWVQNAVKSVHNKIKLGTKAWFNHKHGTNEPAGRKELGEVVGKIFEEKKDNEVDSYAILYRYPEYRDINVDIASYEGSVLCPDDPNIDSWDVAPEHIGEVTGIALGNSQENQPAFPRAEMTLQFQIQNFAEAVKEKEEKVEETETKTKVENKKEVKKIMDLEEMKIVDIKKAVKEKELTVFDLFNNKEILEDEKIQKIIDSQAKEKNGVIERHDKKIEKLTNDIKEQKDKYEKELNDKEAEHKKALEEKEAELTKQITEKNKEIGKLNANEKIEAIIKDRKLDEESPAIAKLVRKSVKKFNPTGDNEKIESEAKEFVDGVIAEIKEWEKDGVTLSIKQEKEKEKDKESDKKKDKSDKKEESKKDNEAIKRELKPDFMKQVSEREKELAGIKIDQKQGEE